MALYQSELYHSLGLDLFLSSGSYKVCYILLPVRPEEDDMLWYQEMASELGIHLVIVSGMDWNNQLTPWTAPSLRKRDSDFGGGAMAFLDELSQDIFPYVERKLGFGKRVWRSMVGVSLSGLFSVWSLYKSDLFNAMGSISGSFWYDGFEEWIRKQDGISSGNIDKLIMLLGEKEKDSRNGRLAKVESASRAVYELLRPMTVKSELGLVEGTHFSSLRPRMERVLRFLGG